MTTKDRITLEHAPHQPACRTRSVPLPEAPKTGSPVPWLTSIHATPGRRPYGKPTYCGNCSGLLIRDLLAFYRPKRVLDPMQGGGTCRDVCRELGIRYLGADLRTGFDATVAANFRHISPVDFVWLHPPYGRMVRYNPEDPRCLSNATTLDDFRTRLGKVLANCRAVLCPEGKLALLIGDLREQGRYQGLPFVAWGAAMDAGFRLAAPEIVRFQHGVTSSRKAYKEAFIPRLHDLCFVFEPDVTPDPNDVPGRNGGRWASSPPP